VAKLAITGSWKHHFDVKRIPGFTSLAIFCIITLYGPLVMMAFFSFNEGRSVTIFSGFSWTWYIQAAGNKWVQNATFLSLKLAAVATFFATIAATMAGLATTRRKSFRGQAVVYGIINQPLMIPEIVTAVATLTFFGIIKQITGVYGVGYLMLAHTVFCIPFAYMPIRARLEDMDLTLEYAAADLYATPWRVFRRVTLPLMLPGILAGAMLSFVISLDDVIISMLVAGPGETTLPIWMIGQLRRGLTPEINAISTVLIGVSFIAVSLVFLLTLRKR
jgi:spermidine/putrescine transport system permease protein